VIPYATQVLGAGGLSGLPNAARFPGSDEEDERDASLRNASAKGDVEEVVQLLGRGANHASRDKTTGNQALHCAAQAGRLDVVKKLVEAGASIDDQNLTGKRERERERGRGGDRRGRGFKRSCWSPKQREAAGRAKEEGRRSVGGEWVGSGWGGRRCG
jgi:hypothetical protein